MEKRSLVIVGINLTVLVGYHIVISQLHPRNSAYHAGPQNDTLYLMGLICAHFIFNIFAFIWDRSKKQNGYILSAFLVLIIGFGLCNWIAPLRF